MDRFEALAEAERLIGPALAADLTVSDWDAALALSLLPDASGVLPGGTGYVDTYDPHWVAAEAVTALAIRTAASGTLQKFTAEGATFETAGPDLWAMAALLRARSIIGKANTAALGLLEVDGRLSTYYPTSGTRTGGLSVLPNGNIVPAGLDWT